MTPSRRAEPPQAQLTAAAPEERRRLRMTHAARRVKFFGLRGLAAALEPLARHGRAPASGHAGVLMYHRVAPEVPGLERLTWNVTPDRFRDQLAGLLRLGYQAWPLDKMLKTIAEGRPLPPRVFIVTFDDGYANNHTYAWPILRQLQVPATVFLATHYIDSNEPFPFDDWLDKRAATAHSDRWRPLTRAQIREMLGDPLIAFGSHTHSHLDFRGEPVTFSGDLANSLAYLRSEFGIAAPSFTFPFGLLDAQMVEIVRASGVRCALTSAPTLVMAGDRPFELGRFHVDGFETPKTLSLKLDGWYGWLKQGSRPRSRAS